MKKIILLFLAACLIQNIISQNYVKIDVDLQKEINLRNPSDSIRINIILNQQYDQNELSTKVSVFSKKEDQRNFVVSELKRFSKETQQGVIDFLNNRTSVSKVQSFWIANYINCYANIEDIEKLSLRSDVLIIGFDKEQCMIPEVEKTLLPSSPTREIASNILKVQANQVWGLGYEGEGIVVGVVDTGVNYDHLDLRDHMWTHPTFPSYFPYHGWDFYNNDNNPMDDNGHGTHCAGTVASDGSAGTQAGVAPKALIMAIKVWDNAGYGSASQMCAGLQFAVDNGANVISMSGGIGGGGSDAERIQFRITMINVLQAGIIAAVAAGNEGPGSFFYVSPPYSIRVPGNCPPPWLHPDQSTKGGLSAVVSVGATDNSDNIAGFSSLGPVTWQSILGYNDYPYNPGMGLIRPDVCAPGVDIKSCAYDNNSGYYQSGWSGTSMATPCVAGTMALMLSKQPNLSPDEICRILETTAVRLPNISSPKGNIFGSGRIDAYAAILNLLACPSINFFNQVVVNSTNITNCSDINVQNVKVQNGAKLTLQAAGAVNIIDNFEVEASSTLDIK